MKRILVPSVLSALALSGCGEPSCLSGADDCVVATACEDLAFTCDGGTTQVYVIDDVSQIPGGISASGAIGDYVLENDQVKVVIEALDHPHYLGISGGSIVDMVVPGQDHDSLRHYWQATGLLPFDYVEYTELEVLEDGDVKSIQLHGTLQGRPDAPVHTRYELHPCEPGVRIRTEIVNLEAEPSSWALLDGMYFGGRENLGFAPFPGGGFKFREFGLGDLTEVMTPVPYVVSGMHTEPAATYATIACNDETVTTFLTEEIVPVGVSPTLVMPRDYIVFERFLAVGDGSAVSVGADLALEVRSQLFDEPYTELSGSVSVPQDDNSAVGEGIRALVTISEGTLAMDAEERTPWTVAIPDDDGAFTVRVPADRSYVAEVEAMGRVVAEAEVDVGSSAADLGDIELPAIADVSLSGTLNGADDGDEIYLLVHPSDDLTLEESEGIMLGHFESCAPMLGHPYGGSPACNRVLVREGDVETVSLVPGTYDFFAVAGPFSTLARVGGVVVEPGTAQSVHLDLETIDGLQPAGTLTGDFHIHARSSFDSSLPDVDRMRAVLASKLEVMASTEHDLVYDFSQVAADLGASDDIAIMTGTESTGHVLWYWNPTVTYPQVTGHWIIWPLTYDPGAPWRGAPWDELVEPGELFTRAADLSWPADSGVIQLNHPVGGVQFGRDFGWASAALIDGNEDLNDDDATTQGLFSRTPEGSDFANDDYHVQEIMNGTNNGQFLQYRAFWHYLLNQGVLRAGTANSDSHTLTDNVVGTPRTLVTTDTTVATFDPVTFNAAVREGRMTGTNGPVLLVSTTDDAGDTRAPSLDIFEPGDSAELSIEVRAAPWVDVQEVRIVVNGEVVETLTDLAAQPDPLSIPAAAADVVRLQTTVSLAGLLPDSGDAWISVEAGTPLIDNADLDCDGWPDTGDNNEDGSIDWRDVEGVEEAPESDCFAIGDAGPLKDPPIPEDRSSADYFFHAVTPHGYPLAFTNPLVLDLDGDGEFTGVTQ
ncbi:MAG: CehA/McbA family metallohydrolase [Proteobacteria bacterium]|nr:CehA/McbA family metallohydrolase [Pseudomonadota bacterium]